MLQRKTGGGKKKKIPFTFWALGIHVERDQRGQTKRWENRHLLVSIWLGYERRKITLKLQPWWKKETLCLMYSSRGEINSMNDSKAKERGRGEGEGERGRHLFENAPEFGERNPGSLWQEMWPVPAYNRSRRRGWWTHLLHQSVDVIAMRSIYVPHSYLCHPYTFLCRIRSRKGK